MVQIRILDADDAPAYRELRLQALSLNPEAFQVTYDDYLAKSFEQIARQLTPSDDRFTLGLFSDEGDLAGSATLIRERQVKVQHIAGVFAVFVLPQFRRNGFGKMLLSELIDRARELPGLMQLKLSVIKENFVALALFESFGFTPYGFEPNALQSNGRYYDEVQMVLPFAHEQPVALETDKPFTKGFSHVTIDVANLAQSLAFYIQILGMKLVHQGRRDAYLEWGTAWVCLQERPEFAPVTQQLGVDHIAFYIEPREFAAKVEMLRNDNVRIIRGPVERGSGWTVNFLDPDGTGLEFHTGSLAERMKTWV